MRQRRCREILTLSHFKVIEILSNMIAPLFKTIYEVDEENILVRKHTKKEILNKEKAFLTGWKGG